MKGILALLFIFQVLSQPNYSQSGVKISGVIKNADQKYIVLAYSPRQRGNLNFDGFRNSGTYIGPNGDFKIDVDSLTHGAIYSLEFGDRVIQLVLFKGDSLHFDLDEQLPERPPFVKGTGAGKINLLNLSDLQYDKYFSGKLRTNLDEMVSYLDSVLSRQRALLDAIYHGERSAIAVSGSENEDLINRIITETPLSRPEYDIIENRINQQRYVATHQLIQQLSKSDEYKSLNIDLHHRLFSSLRVLSHQDITDIADWWSASALDYLLKIEYLVDKYDEGHTVKYANHTKFYADSNFSKWSVQFIQDRFGNEIFTKYCADISAFLLTIGSSPNRYLNYVGENIPKYRQRINRFEKLLGDGLKNEEYHLGEDTLILDSLKFTQLIERNGKPKYIVFWSAQFAGATVISHLPAIIAFENENADKITFINICIDKFSNRNLWAARIIDNAWISQHYFMPIEGNDNTLQNISSKKISSFCYGGANYTYIDGNGKITNGFRAPMDISKNSTIGL